MLLLQPQLQWRFALTYMFSHPQWKPTWFRIGLVFLLCPTPGWWIALGYRRRVGLNARFDKTPLLPEFKQCWWDCLKGGFQTLLIIITYLLPIMICFWFFAIPDLASLKMLWPWIIVFVLLIWLLPPLFGSTLPLAYLWYFDTLQFSPWEALLLICLSFVIIFPLPACFLNVSITGRMLDAYRVDRAWRIIARQPTFYLEAWLLSGSSTVIAGMSGPFMTWGYCWSYLVILSSFNQVLVKSHPELNLSSIENTLMKPNDARFIDGNK